jgi:thioredoxin:protein disulfide reductase
MSHPWSRACLLSFVAATLVAVAVPASAQLRRIPAEIAPLVESDGVRAGSTVRAALKVTLPEGYHVQSNKPRDESLIATEVTVEAPAGITVEELVFPEAEDFVQEGLPEPLLVFDREFTVGVRLLLPAGLAPGEVTVPVRLRYQACDDKMCYAPSNAQSQWTLTVVAATAAVTPRHAEVFDSIAFGTGEKPVAADAVPAPAPVVAQGPDAGITDLDRFTVTASTGGYLGTGDFLTFISNAEAGITEQGMFEGRGPLAILFIVFLGGLALNLTPCVLPMIPINLAIIGAGAQAGSRQRGFLLGAHLRRRHGLRLRRARRHRRAHRQTFGTINASPWFNLGIAVLFVALALAMFDVFEIDFSRFSGSTSAAARAAARSCWRSRWARSRRCWPGRAWRRWSSRSCCSPATSTPAAPPSRWRCRSSSASAWRCHGRWPAPASRRSPSPARGWCASSRGSAC